MTVFIFLLVVITSIWVVFLGRIRTNPKRALLFVISSLFYFVAVFISFFYVAGGPS